MGDEAGTEKVTFPIIAQRFTPESFAAYVAGIALPGIGGFDPQFVVLHNTSSPTLAQRPSGFTSQHMANLEDYYSGLGWAGGPHCFIDDKGIWVFNPLNKRGTHSPSWNSSSWGIEMLGEYGTEDFATGRGALVRDNAVAALAVLCRKIGIEPGSIRFHKEDPGTTHRDCPGINVHKADVISRVALYLTTGTATRPTAWSVEYDDEQIVSDCKDTAAVRAIVEKAFGGTIGVDDAKKVITVYRPK